MGFFDNLVKSIFGNKSDRDYKEMQPIVAEINAEYEKLKSLSNDELRNKTADFFYHFGISTPDKCTPPLSPENGGPTSAPGGGGIWGC